METILNLVWLGVTLAAVYLWRFRWTVSRRNQRHSTRMEAVAIVCALALLFPVISLTDDLHPETVAVDAVGGKRNACLNAASAPHLRGATASSRIHLAGSILSGPFAGVHFDISGIVLLVESHDPISFLASLSLGRSPPSLL